MLQFLPSIDPAAGVLWVAAVAGIAFLVSYLATDRLGIPRLPYVGVLTVATAGLAGSYLVWGGAGLGSITNNWAWGLVGAAVAGGLLFLGTSRIPVMAPHREGGAALIAWDAVVYGATEGLLLSVLPVAAVWQIFAGAGWVNGWLAPVAGVAALAGSALVIVTHHLGYRGFRGREMVFPVAGCLVLSLAFLLTGSVIAPMAGHMILHVGLMRRGSELPPFEQTEARAAAPIAAAAHQRG